MSQALQERIKDLIYAAGLRQKGILKKGIRSLEQKEVLERKREMEAIKRIKRELKHQGAIVDMYSDTMQLPDGKTAQWDYIEHRKGAAAVVAVLPDGKLLLVKQYRNALERFTLEIPAGARDSKEEPYIACAARELEEETGYRCENLEYLISIKTTVAFCNEAIEVYVARKLIPSKQHLDPDEYVELEAHTLEELVSWIYEGKIQDSKTVAAILAYKNKYA